MSVRIGAAIVNAFLSVANPPPGFATVMSNTVPAALRLAGAEVTATSRPVELNDVTTAEIPAPPATGVKVTVGFTALAPDPDCRKPDPWITTMVPTVPVLGAAEDKIGRGPLPPPPPPHPSRNAIRNNEKRSVTRLAQVRLAI